MSFLQPWLLAALPLAALPIIIHLINQRRFQTVQWAAMMFLLAANRMSRGYARLRQWLILLFRALAIATLVFAVSRPLSSGWIGLVSGGAADTSLILLDLSPSMRQGGAGANASKLDTGRAQLAQLLGTLGSSRWVVIDSVHNQPRELDDPRDLLSLPQLEASSDSADFPAMLRTARDYIAENRTGRTEVWICSDLRANDWDADSARWQAVRDDFLKFTQGIRFHLLAYPRVDATNLAVRVTSVRRQPTADGADLLLSIRLSKEGAKNDAITPAKIPVQFEIDGALSVVDLEMTGSLLELNQHRITLGPEQRTGWGVVRIPADANPGDNEFYFVYDELAPRRTMIVSEEPSSIEPILLAASIPPDPAIRASAEFIAREQLAAVEWETVAMLVWHARLPDPSEAARIEAFLQRGGSVLFLPPRDVDDRTFMGLGWQGWSDLDSGMVIDNWRTDQDLLGHTASGAPLPVGSLEIRRHCSLAGEAIPLATTRGGQLLLARAPTERGAAYFCATTAAPGDSSLATEGVVLYVAVQRAIAAGAESLGGTRQVAAGEAKMEPDAPWKRVGGSGSPLSPDYAFHSGVYQTDDHWLAINRRLAEDHANVLADERLADLFRGLDFARVDDQAGSRRSLIQEVWRLFLASMLVALVVEAALCLPKVARAAAGGAP